MKKEKETQNISCASMQDGLPCLLVCPVGRHGIFYILSTDFEANGDRNALSLLSLLDCILSERFQLLQKISSLLTWQ